MNNRDKTKAGVALALGVLADAEADVIYYQPNLTVENTWTVVGVDPFNLSATDGSNGLALTLSYFCWGYYLRADGLTSSDIENYESWYGEDWYTRSYYSDFNGNLGETVSSALALGDTVSSTNSYGMLNTQYLSSEEGIFYVGFRLSTTNNATEYNYGYLCFGVSMQTYTNAAATYTLTLYDVAYESEVGTPITVGAVPEPATGALLMMSVLMLGVFRKLKFRIYGNR